MPKDIHVQRIRKEVAKFAEIMEHKLSLHDANRTHSWKDEPVLYLFKRAKEEMDELFEELTVDPSVGIGINPDRVAKECADVANIVMMIADAVGGLK